MDRPSSTIGIADAGGTTHLYRLAPGAAPVPPPAAKAPAARSSAKPAETEAVPGETEQ